MQRVKLVKQTLLLAAMLLAGQTVCTGQCPSVTTKGNDFWVAFLYNQNIDSTTIDQLQIHCILDQPGTCYFYDTAGEMTTLPVYNTTAGCCRTVGHNNMRIAEPFYGAWHVTSDVPIWVYARNLVNKSEDIAMVLPTSRLSTRYIVQDYPASQHGGEVAFVATQDNTMLTMTVPCNIRGTSITAGTTLNVSLNTGQTYLLMAADGSASFSGMEVVSNGKPFALFQGGWNPAVPANSQGGDHMFEQAVPPDYWGTEFIVAGAAQRAGENRVRITAADGNCSVTINGTVLTTLAAGETYEYTMNSSSIAHIVTKKQSSVVLYIGGSQSGSTSEPSSVTIPPVDRGVCDNVIVKPTSNEILNLSMVLVCKQTYYAGMRLNGNSLPASGDTIIDGYRVHRINSLSSYNTLTNASGPYVAYCYGLGDSISYAYPLAMELTPRIYDTVVLYDNTCVGAGYHNNGFDIPAEEIDTLETLTLERDDTLQNYYTHYVLHLTVHPTQTTDLYDSIVFGDTMIWHGVHIYDEGDYTTTLISLYGCDSLVTLHVSFTPFDTIFLFDTACAGSIYNNYGFMLELPDTSGDFILTRRQLEDGSPKLYFLKLTLLPTAHSDLYYTIVDGDALLYNDTSITTVGDYAFRFTAANGCDSIVTLHLRNAELGLTASSHGVCPGDEVVLTASGTYNYIWSSSPYDPELDSLQGLNPITVHPTVTTEYQLLDGEGNIACRTTVGAAPPPVLCIETSRNFVDFDHPRVIFTDCSEGRHHSLWQFSDGTTATGQRVLHEFAPTNDDSVVVILSSCNNNDCCADTTFSLPCHIRSVWFPDIFTPDEEENNLFRCFTSRNIVEFELTIFNRWGLFIWSTTDVQQGWDGRRTDGTPCRQDAYVYRYTWHDAEGEMKSGIGTVTLIR